MAAEEPLSAQAKLAWVDPFIGNGPDGHTFPGATAPFGMMQLSPETQIRPFKQSYKSASGYSQASQLVPVVVGEGAAMYGEISSNQRDKLHKQGFGKNDLLLNDPGWIATGSPQ